MKGITVKLVQFRDVILNTAICKQGGGSRAADFHPHQSVLLTSSKHLVILCSNDPMNQTSAAWLNESAYRSGGSEKKQLSEQFHNDEGRKFQELLTKAWL